MMSYRHAFHAGGYADVHKHVVVGFVMQHLVAKDKPLCYLESHGGRGRYSLDSAEATKTGAWRDGIGRIWGRKDAPSELAPYLDAVAACNGGRRELRRYPGSPLLAAHFMRADDRMVVAELHRGDGAALTETFAGDDRVRVVVADGWKTVRAALPPVERRGAVMIDPPYDQPDELGRVIEFLRFAVRRWATGTYLLWYPLIERAVVDEFLAAVVRTGVRKTLVTELSVGPAGDLRVPGAGVVVVNAPWKLDALLQAVAPWLHARMAADGAAPPRVEWLVGD